VDTSSRELGTAASVLSALGVWVGIRVCLAETRRYRRSVSWVIGRVDGHQNSGLVGHPSYRRNALTEESSSVGMPPVLDLAAVI
jgi:hypothetical protein